jgi:hypothetical protein
MCSIQIICVNGILENPTSTSLVGSEIIIDYLDENNNIIISNTVPTLLPATMPGFFNAFYDCYQDQLPSEDYTVRIENTSETSVIYRPITVVAYHIKSAVTTSLTLTLRNDQQKPVQFNHLLVRLGNGRYSALDPSHFFDPIGILQPGILSGPYSTGLHYPGFQTVELAQGFQP